MIDLSEWFLYGPIPKNALVGHYEWSLVVLSYAVATFSSFVTLSIVSRLRAEQKKNLKYAWLAAGAFVFGSGIWSMHFIGMLAFVLPIDMDYHVNWTLASFFAAVFASALAFHVIKGHYSTRRIYIGAIAIGLCISLMHYLGMKGMESHVDIHYIPSMFALSIIVAIIASGGALWLAFHTDMRSTARQFGIQIISSFVMGGAVCGMHYIGMDAAVFTPLVLSANHMHEALLQPTQLAYLVGGLTIIEVSFALVISAYHKKIVGVLENEKEFLNAMLDNIEDGIIACDAMENVTVLNNVLQKNILSNKPNKKVSDLFELFDYYSEDNRLLTIEERPLLRALRGERVHGLELTMKFRNKVSREVVIDGQSIFNSKGQKLGAVIVIHDVTELKRAEKLKNEFVSTVSHELRTPLTSIRGSLGLLMSGMMGTLNEKGSKLLEIAHNNCERLLLLINDILDIEKIEAGKMSYDMKRVDLNALVIRCIEENRMYADKFGVDLQFIEATSHVFVYADVDRLCQVITNLISNACKFSPKGEKVILSISCDNDLVRVSVSDKGPGIPYAFQSRIFQKFSQADSSDTRGKGGTGLGLNISKQIIEEFGGTIKFFSIPNEGATFYFEMEIQEEIKLKGEDSVEATNVQPLLLCEDDVDQADYLKALLESSGYHVDIASTVREAKLKLATGIYHALLLDLILPDQDGLAFIKELRAVESTRDLNIIVLSVIAQTGCAMLEEGGLAVAAWLDKPVDLKVLLSTLKGLKQGQIEAQAIEA